MPELTGPLAQVEPSTAIRWILAGPLAGALLLGILTVVTSRFGRDESSSRARRFGEGPAVAVALLGMVASLGVTIAETIKVAELPAGTLLYAHLWPVARIGSVVVDCALALDRLSATF